MIERDSKLELVALLFVLGSGSKLPSRADARKALLPLLKASYGDAEAKRKIDGAIEACVADTLVEETRVDRASRFRITSSGKSRLEREFGKIESASWTALRDSLLVRRTLSDTAEPTASLKSYADLRAFIALRASGIEFRAGMSEAAVLNRIAAKAVGAARADKTAIRTALIRSWLGTSGDAAVPRSPSEAAFDLAAFAHAVMAAARHATSGHWGTNKVFVNHVWRHFSSPTANVRDLGSFKRHLLEANRLGLVHLSRADLVINMPSEDVRDSEIATIGSDVFHFVNL